MNGPFTRVASFFQPSPLNANLLYLLSMALILTAGAAVQKVHPFRGLIATELLLILLPALAWAALGKQNFRETFRWRWPGFRLVLLGLLIGFGLWPLSITLDQISSILFGYSPITPFSIPESTGEQILYAVGMVIFAPLCEEILFRGFILTGYKRMHSTLSVIIVGGMFALFHLRLQGLLAILPISFALTYIARRSSSIFPGILAHLAFNSSAVTIALLSTSKPDLFSAPTTLMLMSGMVWVGLLLAIGCLWLFRHLTSLHPSARKADLIQISPSSRMLAYFPLLLAVVLYGWSARVEWISMRTPEKLAGEGLILNAAPWTQPVSLVYEIRNVISDPVGRADCMITPTQSRIELDCRIEHKAFLVKQTSSTYQDSERLESRKAAWDAADMRLIEVQTSEQGNQFFNYTSILKEGDHLFLTTQRENIPAISKDLPLDVYFIDELPWRLSALPFTNVGPWGNRLPLAWALRYIPEKNTSEPFMEEAVIQVVGKETLVTPAGTFQAWKVTLSYHMQNRTIIDTAWYTSDPPHTLIKYQQGTGMFTYILVRETRME